MKRLISFGASVTLGIGVSPTQNYSYLLQEQLGIEVINKGIGGASNLEILFNILSFKYQQGDGVVIMWGYSDRDYIFDNNKNIPLGPWQNTDIVKHWLMTHNSIDLGVRSWYQIHHANLFLDSKQIQVQNIAFDQAYLEKFKPNYIDTKLLDIRIQEIGDMFPRVADGHLNSQAHLEIANRIQHVL